MIFLATLYTWAALMIVMVMALAFVACGAGLIFYTVSDAILKRAETRPGARRPQAPNPGDGTA